MYQSTVMCETSQQKDLKQTEYPKSTSYVEDFPVKMLAQQVKELVSLIVKGTLPAPVFGESMPGLFASLNQDGLWLKTWQGYCQSLLPDFGEEDSELFCETWPKWGIVLDGHAMELPMLERRIKDKECSLWPTVTTDTSDRKKKCSQGGTPLTLAVKKNWPTPTVADTFTGNLKSTQQKPGSMHSVNLSQAVNWPTPRAREGNSGSYGCASIERNADRNYLDGVVIKKEEKPGNLNADWVELLMGLPIGWTDIDIAYEDIGSWPGWPAPLNNLQNWGTHTAAGTVRSDEFIRGTVSPAEFVKKDMQSDQYDYEPPRVVVGQKNRAKRLKSLGNGCVSQQIYLIFAAVGTV